MDALPGRETPQPSAVEPIDGTPRSELDPIESEDPELEAWLAARDVELDEMAWAIADRYRDEVGQ
jgi:hypothetical protein